MPSYVDLNDSERAWVAKHVDLSCEIVTAYTGQTVDDLPSISQLDRAWEVWLGGDARTIEDPNAMINVFGLAFGENLVRGLGMGWVVVTDEYGTDIGVLGQPGELLAFPTNAVAKRWESGETGFFVPLYSAFAERRR